MTNFKTKIFFIKTILFLITITSCKKEVNNIINKNKETNDTLLTNKEEKKVEIEIKDNKTTFKLIDVKQISNNKPIDSIISRLKSIKIEIKDNIITLNNYKAKFTTDKSDSKKFFSQNYIYKFYTDYLYKNYNIDIKNQVNYVEIGYEDSQKYPFKDFFLEGGVTVFEKDYLILQYSDYLIVFKKTLNNNSNTNNNLVSLPFDYQKYLKECYLKENTDCERRYPKIQDDEFKLITSIVNKKISKNKPEVIYHINNGGLPFETYVLQIRDDKEEYFLNHIIINIKNNNLISKQLIGKQLDGEAPEDLTYTAKTFTLNKNLNIDVFEMRFSKIYKKIESYKLNSDGSLSKI